MRNETLAVLLLLGCSILSGLHVLGGVEARDAAPGGEARVERTEAGERARPDAPTTRVELLAVSRPR